MKKRDKKKLFWVLLIICILLIIYVSIGLVDIFKRININKEIKGEVGELYNAPGENLVAYYPFEGNANDISGNGNNGAVYGATNTTGKFGKAYKFSGNGYINITPGNFDLEEVSISLWFKGSYMSNYYSRLLQKRDTSGRTRGFIIAGGYYNNRLTGCYEDLGNKLYCNETSITFSNDVWYNLIMVYNGGKSVKLYVNGVDVTRKGAYNFGSYSGNYFNIGRMAGSSSRYFYGIIDEIKIWDYALSDSEVMEQYLGCVDECSIGDVICDETANGNKSCGNFDSDACLDWSVVSNCLESQTCSEGVCIDTTPLCDDDDWISYITPEICPESENQTRNWTKNEGSICEGGVTHPASEVINCTYIRPCDNNDWISNVTPVTCPDSRNQTRNWTKINQTCEGGVTHLDTEVINCTRLPACVETDWAPTIYPETCPSSRKQTKNWTRVGECEGGLVKTIENITCNPDALVCTSWTYSNWGNCTSSKVRSRTVTSSSPVGCEGGNPKVLETCCIANCSGKDCGPDGCGGNCGVCNQPALCVNAKCQVVGNTGEEPEEPIVNSTVNSTPVEEEETPTPVSAGKMMFYAILIVIIILIIIVLIMLASSFV